MDSIVNVLRPSKSLRVTGCWCCSNSQPLDFLKTEFLSFSFLWLDWNFESCFWACLKGHSGPHVHSGQKILAGPQNPEKDNWSSYKPLDPLLFSMQMELQMLKRRKQKHRQDPCSHSHSVVPGAQDSTVNSYVGNNTYS